MQTIISRGVASVLMATLALAPTTVAAQGSTSGSQETTSSSSTGTGAGASSDMSLLTELPTCAVTCLLDLTQKDTLSTCQGLDLECLCATPAFVDAATACVIKSCSIKESLTARNLTSTACHDPIRDNSQTYTTVAITFSVISCLAVMQRFVAKLLAENLTLGYDDYMVLLAALVQAPMAAVGVEGGVACGLGRDIWTLTFDQITGFGYWLYVFTILYFLNVAIVKLTFLLFYLRVFPRPKIRRYLWATIAFTCIFGFTFVMAGIFQCQPVSHYWERWTGEKEGKCIDVSALAWANGSISIALDLWMIAIPLSQVRNLSLDWKKKAEVAFMFCVGLFVTVMSSLRLESLVTHDVHSPNATWVKREVAIWSTVEINVGIICACLPSIRTLLVFAFGRVPLIGSTPNPGAVAQSSDFWDYRNTKAFGTISRSIAEPADRGVMPARPPNAGIRMERTCAVEFETVSETGSDETKLVPLGNLNFLRSSSSQSLDREKERQSGEDGGGGSRV